MVLMESSYWHHIVIIWSSWSWVVLIAGNGLTRWSLRIILIFIYWLSLNYYRALFLFQFSALCHTTEVAAWVVTWAVVEEGCKGHAPPSFMIGQTIRSYNRTCTSLLSSQLFLCLTIFWNKNSIQPLLRFPNPPPSDPLPLYKEWAHKEPWFSHCLLYSRRRYETNNGTKQHILNSQATSLIIMVVLSFSVHFLLVLKVSTF